MTSIQLIFIVSIILFIVICCNESIRFLKYPQHVLITFTLQNQIINHNIYINSSPHNLQWVSYKYHDKRKSPINGLFTSFMKLSLLFKLAEFGLIQVIFMWLSILFCIDNLYFFHTLFFVSHIFSTNPVPLHFFIIVCSSGGLQVSFTTHRIIFCRFACPPMEIIIYIQYFCKKKFCGTNR